MGAELGENGAEEMQRLRELWSCVRAAGLEGSFFFDSSITRGLDYYTGVVFETFLHPPAADRLGLLGGPVQQPGLPLHPGGAAGVGASIGLDRLLAALESLGALPPASAAPDLLVLFLDEALLGEYHRLAEGFRQAGLSAEVYPSRRKLSAQFHYAEKRGIPLAVVYGEEEKAKGGLTLKDLRTRQSWENRAPAEVMQLAAEVVRPSA